MTASTPSLATPVFLDGNAIRGRGKQKVLKSRETSEDASDHGSKEKMAIVTGFDNVNCFVPSFVEARWRGRCHISRRSKRPSPLPLSPSLNGRRTMPHPSCSWSLNGLIG